MGTITVTTASDTVANDGVVSLREAIALAGAKDTVVFDRHLNGIFNLSSPLAIGAGKTVTIDGGLFPLNQIFGVLINGQIVVEAGANVTLRQLAVSMSSPGVDGPFKGEDGDGGTAGADGLDGVGKNQPGTRGMDGTHGVDGTKASGAALGELGTIQNFGHLSLDYVEVLGGVNGGNGGHGGWGGHAGLGGHGGWGTGNAKGANAGRGGSGGSGAEGTDGADVIAGIWNSGQLILKDSLITEIPPSAVMVGMAAGAATGRPAEVAAAAAAARAMAATAAMAAMAARVAAAGRPSPAC